jgi:hypothetical protein
MPVAFAGEEQTINVLAATMLSTAAFLVKGLTGRFLVINHFARDRL